MKRDIAAVFRCAAVVAGLCAGSVPGRGLIFISTADPAFNSAKPIGTLASSGWDFEGYWGNFVGTPIAPNYFITAAHVGGNIGDSFYFRGEAYTTSAVFKDSATDLQIWRVSGTFPAYAPVYARNDEVGKNLVVFGRGTQRGVEVHAGGLLGSSLKGWQWGTYDGVLRWGQNHVEEIITAPANSTLGPQGAQILRATFDENGGVNEADFSYGDSGGGIFINDGSAWKLAGINLAVEGAFNTAPTGAGFQAAVFDRGGLYEGTEGNWTLVPALPTPQPGSFFATLISPRVAWIEGILAQPLPPTAPVLQSATAVNGTFTDVTGATVDATAKTITIAIGSGSRFFRLRSSASTRIVSTAIQGSNLVLHY